MSVACLDIGTSAVKAALIDADGAVLATGTAAYPTHRKPGGVVEQSPEGWWNACRAAFAQCGPLAQNARALSVTGQMQDLILLDDGAVVQDALLYSDQRAGVEHAELVAAMPDWDDRAWRGAVDRLAAGAGRCTGAPDRAEPGCGRGHALGGAGGVPGAGRTNTRRTPASCAPDSRRVPTVTSRAGRGGCGKPKVVACSTRPSC